MWGSDQAKADLRRRQWAGLNERARQDVEEALAIAELSPAERRRLERVVRLIDAGYYKH